MKKLTLFFILIFFTFQGNLMATKLEHIKYNDIEIPIIYKKHKTLPIFNLYLIFKNSGYINDTILSGLTNLSAKVLNEGTLKDGSNLFYEKLENNAIEINAQAGFETFTIEISCLKDKYKLALQYLNELLINPNINKKTLNKVKNITLSKLAQKQNDFDYIASSQLKNEIYKNTALSNTGTGTIEDINKINISNIKTNITNILNINNLIVVTGGDIQYNVIENDLISIFNNLNNDKTKILKKIHFNKQAKSTTIKKETEQSYIYFASNLDINSTSVDNYKLKVASFILGSSGFGSRLMEEIRVKNGLAYSVYGYFINKKSHSHFSGYLQTKLDNTKKAKDMVISIVNKFIENGVTKEELQSAKKFLLGSQPLRTERFSQSLNQAFNLYYNNLDFDYYKEEAKLIEKLTLKDLNIFISKHTEIKNLVFSIVTK
jgi:predicted Zn-dependent peptidase